jgi:hypothetical protein
MSTLTRVNPRLQALSAAGFSVWPATAWARRSAPATSRHR